MTEDDPTAMAAARTVQYVTLAAMAAESVLAARAARTDRAAGQAATDATRLRGQYRAAHAAARLQWLPALHSRPPGGRTVDEAATAWAAAQGWTGVVEEAAQAAGLAEQRLRVLDPDLVDRLDRLRADGHSPAQALRLAGLALDADHRAGPPALGLPAADAEAACSTVADLAAQAYPLPVTAHPAPLPPRLPVEVVAAARVRTTARA